MITEDIRSFYEIKLYIPLINAYKRSTEQQYTSIKMHESNT